MMARSFTAAALETLLVLAASKVTSWAVASCFHETTSWMETVRAEGAGAAITLSLIRVFDLSVGGFALKPAYGGLASFVGK